MVVLVSAWLSLLGGWMVNADCQVISRVDNSGFKSQAGFDVGFCFWSILQDLSEIKPGQSVFFVFRRHRRRRQHQPHFWARLAAAAATMRDWGTCRWSTGHLYLPCEMSWCEILSNSTSSVCSSSRWKKRESKYARSLAMSKKAYSFCWYLVIIGRRMNFDTCHAVRLLLIGGRILLLNSYQWKEYGKCLMFRKTMKWYQ